MEESQNDALKYCLDTVCQQNSLEFCKNIWIYGVKIYGSCLL